MGSTWDPPGCCRPQMGPMLASWILLSWTSLYKTLGAKDLDLSVTKTVGFQDYKYIWWPWYHDCLHQKYNRNHGVEYTEQTPLIARFMGPTWGPSGADRTQVGPVLAPWSLRSGTFWSLPCDIHEEGFSYLVFDNGDKMSKNAEILSYVSQDKCRRTMVGLPL